jgi:hypothetical protein
MPEVCMMLTFCVFSVSIHLGYRVALSDAGVQYIVQPTLLLPGQQLVTAGLAVCFKVHGTWPQLLLHPVPPAHSAPAWPVAFVAEHALPAFAIASCSAQGLCPRD